MPSTCVRYLSRIELPPCRILYLGAATGPFFLYCYAGLWHEVLVSEPQGNITGLLEMVASDAMYDFCHKWLLDYGIAPHPSVLVAEYRRNTKQPRQRRNIRKRPAASMAS